MDQFRPNLELMCMDETDEHYSSVDDTPQPVDNECKFLSDGLSKHRSQLFQQTMAFHCWPEIKSPQPQEVPSLLPDIVPTLSSPEQEDTMCEAIAQQQSDQVVPNISNSCSFELPHYSNGSDQEFYFSSRPSPKFSHRVDCNSNSIEYRSTKLPSDKSKAMDKALNCFLQYSCSDKECRRGKDLISELEKKIQRDNKVNCDDRQILEYLLEHQRDCVEFFCIAPGCSQIEKCCCSLQGLIKCMKNKISRDIRFSENAKLYRFSTNCRLTHPQDVKENTTHTFHSDNAISLFAMDYGWTKITLLGDMMKEILPLLIKIGQLSNHRNILAIDWLIDDDNISFSSDLYIEPLASKLSCVQKNKYSLGLTKKDIILQLIEAALYLNDNGIAYLAWTSENICWKNGQVKLTNFHMGSALKNDFDPGIIKCLVFPTILPPELNLDHTTLEKADVWGVGCLLYELITYKIVHSDLLHMERHQIWKTLDEIGWEPKCTFKNYYLQRFFRKAWKVNPQERISLEDFRWEILNYEKNF